MQQRCITIWLCFVINPIEYLLVMSECFKGEANTNTHPQELKNMKMKNWNINANKVRVWAESLDQKDPQVQAIVISLGLGDNAPDDAMRSTYWTAIRSIGGNMDGFPSARIGRESTLSDNQLIVMDAVEQKVLNAFAVIPTEHQDLLLSVIVPHGRTGGVYQNWEAFANEMKSKAHTYMLKSIKDGRWNGEDLDNGVPQITPTPTKADEVADEEE